MATGSGSTIGAERQDKGLKRGALGLVSATVIGVASTAPAYSLAATVGLVAAIVGVHAPAIVLVSFIPMLFTAAAYYYLNRVDPDCGATFAWVSRSMGPHMGWMGGWGVVIADIVVMPSLAWVAAYYTYALFGLDSLAGNTWALLGLGSLFILAMTLICWLGIELSARTQFVMLATEIAILIGVSVFTLIDVWMHHPVGSLSPSWEWLNPFSLTTSQLAEGVLVTLFIYWGWDTAANVNEETRRGSHTAGTATLLATLVLVGTYLFAAFATTAYAGPGFLSDNPDDVLTAMTTGPWQKIMMLAILVSAMASTQTTILPTARTTLSMAAHRAAPKALGKIHPKYLTPTWSTWWMGILSIVWWVALIAIDRSENILWDSITGLGFAIAFYYGLTALAAPILFRKHLFTSFKNFVLVGLVPLLGFATLAWVFVRSAIDNFFWSSDTAYTPAWFAFGDFRGLGAPFVIGIGMLLLGIPFMLWWRAIRPAFFRTKAEAAPTLDELLPDRYRVTEETVAMPGIGAKEHVGAMPTPKPKEAARR
jgi:amino acid transporter